MPIKDHEPFSVGKIFHQARLTSEPRLIASEVTIDYPSRLAAMSLDPYTSGQDVVARSAGMIIFSINLMKHIHIKVNKKNNAINITSRTKRASLIRHAALIMREAIGFRHGLTIDVHEDEDLRHCGLGSTNTLISATAAAINELYNKPLSASELIQYCAKNHGEEINGRDGLLLPIGCIGSSGVSGHYPGSLIMIAGSSTPIYTKNLSSEFTIVIGIPKDLKQQDSQAMLETEVNNLNYFKDSEDTYGRNIAYDIVHNIIPAAEAHNLEPCKQLIFKHRWQEGSIKSCATVHPRLLEIAEGLRPLVEDEDVKILSLSSVGPGFFALTDNPDRIIAKFSDLNLRTITAKPYNDTYRSTLGD